jgi:hypothetical protein
MANGNAAPDEPLAGRSMEFQEAATRVRSSNFRTLQNSVGGGNRYRRTSILDNLMPSRVGLGEQDYERAKLGVPRSSSGQSESTFDKGLWLRAERPPDLKTFG